MGVGDAAGAQVAGHAMDYYVYIDILDYDYVYLGAWNFKDVIANKEQEFVKNGGKFITHVPTVMEFS